MDSDSKHTSLSSELAELKNNLFDLSARNPFINSKFSQLHFVENQKGNDLSNLYKSSQFLFKEYGLESSLKVTAFLRWKEPHRNVFFTSPLIITPCEIVKRRKIETEFEIVIEEDTEAIVNPILVNSMKRFYDIDIRATAIDDLAKALKEALSVDKTEIKSLNDWSEEEEWLIMNCEAIGNFNYKKSLLGADFDEIIKNPASSVKHLANGTRNQVELAPSKLDAIVPLDFSQKEVIQLADVSDVSIQGPPGTGKSHSIVGMIGHFLAQNKKVLFVSQKKSALEVVLNRLNKLKIGHLAAYLNTDKDEKKHFYHNLKKTWETLGHKDFEETSVSPLLEDSLVKFYLRNYLNPSDNENISSGKLVNSLIKSGFLKEELNYKGVLPGLNEWNKAENFLLEFETILKKEFHIAFISDCSFINLNKSIFSETDPLVILEKRLSNSLLTLQTVSEIQRKHNVSGTLDEITKFAIAASILSMVNKTQLNLLNNESKEYKSFSAVAKKYQLLTSKFERAIAANSKWKEKPSKSEITELIDLIKHSHAPRGIFGILRRKNERILNAFDGFSPSLTDVGKLQLLEELRSEWNLKGELEELEIKLLHNFNISDPKHEINQILLIRTKLGNLSPSIYQTLLEHDSSQDLILDLSGVHNEIQAYNHVSKFVFEDKEPLLVHQEMEFLENLISNLRDFKLIQSQLEKFFSLPISVRNFIRSNNKTIAELSAISKYYNLLLRHKFDTEFNNLSGDQILIHLEREENLQATHNQEVLNKVSRQYTEAYNAFETLLNTPASRLSDQLKTEKKNIRLNKKNLIHEMGKKQRHQPIKSFLYENWDFVSNLVPLWVMNPLSVSERIPCTADLFDVVIFDEASQIPLEDAIPSVHRAKKVIVVGDANQMPPSSFFKSNEDSDTILNKANFSYPRKMLKWHYRSEHPKLIEFSNKNFYENELLIIPPVKLTSPLKLIECNGVFKDNVNQKEVKEIVRQLKNYSTDNFKNIGIITFSKEQENLVRKEVNKVYPEADSILIRNLENVQGVERDIIFISIGYAKNEEGKFLLNFGPINRENGMNRLNVLFSRAKKELFIFSSVRSSDFGLTDNQGVACLRDFLFDAEIGEKKAAQNYVSEIFGIDVSKFNIVYHSHMDGSAIQCFVQHDKSRVLLIDPLADTIENQDIQTVYSVLKSRYKKVKIVLSIDFWNNPAETETTIRRFFD